MPTWSIEYELPPLRAIYTCECVCDTEAEARNVFSTGIPFGRIRKIEAKPMADYHDFTTRATPKAERVAKNVGDIWINAAECKLCGDVVRSKHRHDCRSCRCGEITVDGGSFYARRIGDQYIDRVEMFDDAEQERQ